MDDELADRADRLLRRCLVWDNHGCMPLRPADDSFLPQMERYRAARVDVVALNVGFGPQDLASHVRVLASMRRWFAARSDRFALAMTVSDVDRARADGKLAVLFDVEGMAPLDAGDHGMVGMLRELGVGWMLVAYNRANAAGGGCHDDDDPGLSEHGRRILAEMRRVGMIACCSHTGDRTAMDVFAAADGPVILSHSNARALRPHPRNVPDALLRACAETGGVVGVNGIGAFLDPAADEDALPGLVARHVDHVAQVTGNSRHVGLALDYVFDRRELDTYLAAMRQTFPDDPALRGPARLAPPERLPEVVAALLRRGWADADVANLLGANWRRVAAQVWR